jgi:hypothetical protein
MNDEEIVKAITLNLALAAVLSSLRQQDKARLFAAHAVRLSTANYAACERWMDRRSVNASEPS